MSLAKEYFVNTYGWRKDWDSPTTDSLDDVVKRLENVSLITYYFIHMLIRVVGRLKVFETGALSGPSCISAKLY